MVRQFERTWGGEPYECGWASKAIFSLRTLETKGSMAGAKLMVQISPDAMHGCDEGTLLVITEDESNICRVRYLGVWLRLVGTLPEGANLRGMVTSALKE